MDRSHNVDLDQRSIPAIQLGGLGWHTVAVTSIVLGLVVAYKPILSVFTADDVFFKHTFDGTYSLALASYVNGRFIPGFIYQLLSGNGFEIYDHWAMLQLLAFVAIAVLSYVFVVCLDVRLSRIETVVTASFIAFIPYIFKLLINKNNSLNATLAYASTCIAIYSFSQISGVWRIIIPTIMLFISFSSYQTSVYYFIIFILGYYFFHGNHKREVCRGLIEGFAACALAVFAYSIVFKLTLAWGLAEMGGAAYAEVAHYYGRPRSGLNDAYGFLISGLIYFSSVAQILFGNQPILPLAIKVLALLLFFIGHYFWTKEEHSTTSLDNGRFVLCKRRIFLILLLLGISSPMHLFLAYNWLSPRVYAHAGAVWAILIIAALMWGPQKWRRGMLAGGLLFALGLHTYSARTANLYASLYRGDIELGREVVAALRQQPDYRAGGQIAVVGKMPKDSRHTQHIFDYFDIVPSKFHQPWSRIAILEEASGERFRRPSRDFTAQAQSLCASLSERDTLFHVEATTSGGVVCLPSTWDQRPVESK